MVNVMCWFFCADDCGIGFAMLTFYMDFAVFLFGILCFHLFFLMKNCARCFTARIYGKLLFRAKTEKQTTFDKQKTERMPFFL